MASLRHGGRATQLIRGRTIFQHADDLGVQVPSSCGRLAHCHECVVEIRRGMSALSPKAEPESFLRENYRLACQSVVQDPDQEVEFELLRRRPRILTTGTVKEIEIDPLVTRKGDQVLYDGTPLDRWRGHLYGVALDVGTTTIVLELVDLETCRVICMSSFENPQRFGGSDVMSRISYDGGPFHGELHKAVISALNRELQQMCRELKFDRHEIYEIVAAGNSTMRELFFGLDVQSIGQRPYKSQVEHEYLSGLRDGTGLLEPAHKLGIWAHPRARVVGPPLVASHVGADTLADLVAIDMDAQDRVVMLIDVGTNTEVVLGHKGRMLAASCPAGPAFEGGLIKYGMPGCDGAIESLRLNGAGFTFRTIGGGEPQGICGSGLIDLLAELRIHGKMTPKGVFPNRAKEIEVAPAQGITLSREDASNLAQAKAANYCGQFILLRKFGVNPADIHRLYLAGGFANYIDVSRAMEIGFLAPVPEDRIVKVGNAAIQGAREMLLSRRKRDAAQSLIRRIEHVELETIPDFFEIFVEGCQFKPMPQHVK